MASISRKKVVASRRRREDEGEEEGSVAGDLEDNSLSEGSIISNGDDDADIEPSDVSDDDVVKAQHNGREPVQPNPSPPAARKSEEPEVRTIGSNFVTSSDTKAMMNGLQLIDGKDVLAVEFDEATADAPNSVVGNSRSQPNVSREAPTERGRREHLEYLKQKKENPAFVPNRGGFFLHDNRAAPSGPNGFRTPARGRGRGGFGGFQSRYVL
jgi:CASC3/Barentsz eIF4AIII binding